MPVTRPTPLRPRVCLVAPEFIGPFPNGGVGTACYWEARALVDAGFDVTVLYTGPTDRESPAHWERAYREAGFTYVDLSAWATACGEATAVDRAAHPCAEARTSELVLRFLRGQRFDLLLFQEFLGHGARTLQARRAGDALAHVPAAVTLHSSRQWIYEGMRRVQASQDDMYVDFLERESARLADRVMAPSRHMAEWVAAHWPLTAPATIVPYCYDTSFDTPAGRVEHAGPFEHLVFFGRLETRKGLHLFCRALASSDLARGPVRNVTFLGKPSTVDGRPSREFIQDTLGALADLQIDIIDRLGSFEALDWLARQPRTLVVAPSLVDNLPYSIIELFTRRIPFISTRIGGIPEIVGAANAHLLAEATVGALAEMLGAVHREDRLVTDYREGYASASATESHVDILRSLLRRRPDVRRTRGAQPWLHASKWRSPRPAEVCDVVIVDAEGEKADDARRAFVSSDPTARNARFVTWDAWRDGHPGDRAALFVSASVRPTAGLVERLLHTLADRRVAAATSYYCDERTSEPIETAPLGASLECGWARNVFGGPCLAAAPDAFTAIRDAAPGPFQFWPVYAALACAALELALVPESLYASDAAALDETPEAMAAVERLYGALDPGALDLGWVLRHARTGAGPSSTARTSSDGRAFYDHLLAIPDDHLANYAGLTALPDDDRFIGELLRLRRQLVDLVSRWRITMPRVLVYGAGEHTRALLALEPGFGPFIAGFIDRRPISQFLGRPCIRPEAVTADCADVVLYSSREFERDMYARLAAVPVEHILLYSAVPDADSLRNPTMATHHLSAPDERSLAGLRKIYCPPAWATGFISGGDTEFLLRLVTAVQPRSVLELGVASGASSAALLFALDQLPACEPPRRLLSCDVRPTCYFDTTKPTGGAVREMYPGHRAEWTLNTDTDARRLSQSLPPASMDMLFIDANHSHPWALIDLLHLTAIAAPGAWIALHDIELPLLNPAYQVHGPQWLFEAWPFNKEHGVDASRNIGAIQLPADLSALVPIALALLARPWEHTPTTWDVDLPEMFADVSAVLKPRLKRPAEALAG